MARSHYSQQVAQTEKRLEVEVGPVKVQSEGIATYIIIFSAIVLCIFYIYAKFFHHKVMKRIKRKR